MPDVWLRYIRVAEDARNADKSLPAAAVDVLLTPSSGTTPGYIAQQLRSRLAQDDRHGSARIAQSTSRVVASIDFLTLCAM